MSLRDIVEVLRYERVPLSKLRVASTNNRIVIPPEQEMHILIDSIKAVGITEPLIVNEDYEIISGQLRYIAGTKANVKDAPVVVCKFKDKYHERVASLLTDTGRTPLSEQDKFNFMQKAIEVDKKTVEQVAIDLGLAPPTVRAWYNWGKSPTVVQRMQEDENLPEEDRIALSKYMESGIKKKKVIDDILETPLYRNSPKKALEIIKPAPTIPLRVYEDIRKEAEHGVPTDMAQRTKVLEEDSEMIHVRIPKELFKDFMLTLGKEQKDMYVLITELIRDWVNKRKS